MRDVWVVPYLRWAAWVAEHPSGRRFPIPGRKRQPGQTNAEAFCANWVYLADSFPGLVEPGDWEVVAPVFRALEAQQREAEQVGVHTGG